jgi:CelD/BcsL family acetyltransferase involved in cellulose biosynthesis
MSALLVRRWTNEEWLANQASWTALQARSSSDRLFLSWEWLTLWWRCYGSTLGRTPEILAFYRGADLVGLVPLYHRRVMRGGLVLAHSVQVIGLSWRDPEPLISEYLDVIAAREDLDEVRHACAQALVEEPSWSELVFGFTAAADSWREAFAAPRSNKELYVRNLDRCVSYQADLSDGFGPYLRTLGQSTRRSLWNLRHRLASFGEVRVEQLREHEIEEGFEDLNRLHTLRWKRPAFTGKRLSFHTSLARLLAPRGELAFSRLRIGGELVSVLYDIRREQRQYNLKMGFDPRFSVRVSLGLIHLGYAMEAAAAEQIRIYDFLAGPGRTSDYKRHLSQVRRDLSCVQILRGRLLPSLYRWRDRAR